jgi:hypothetical protein
MTCFARAAADGEHRDHGADPDDDPSIARIERSLLASRL